MTFNRSLCLPLLLTLGISDASAAAFTSHASCNSMRSFKSFKTNTAALKHSNADLIRVNALKNEEETFSSSTKATNNFDIFSKTRNFFEGNEMVTQVTKSVGALFLASALTLGTVTTIFPEQAQAADGAAIGFCLLKQCRLELAKCITNPNCLANVICINTCNGKEDETGCQIECGNIFENNVVGEFNKCAVSDMSCVPQKPDDNSYPVPAKESTVKKFDTSLFNGRWYITAGQNQLFDIFPCQVHFFTETAPGKFFGKLNWRIEEPDGEFFTRDALQQFVQDKDQPGHLINHDNEYLHYEDDWYILDYEPDNNPEGIPPFALVYYRGSNDAWIGYGGAVVYTRDSKLPESIVPRLQAAAKKVNYDFEKDFTRTDNTCRTMDKGEATALREKFAGKVAIQTEKQLQAQTVLVRTASANSVKAQKIFFSDEVGQVQKAVDDLSRKSVEFEEEILKDAVGLEKELVKDVVGLEKEIVKDVVGIEKEIVKDVVNVEKGIVNEVKTLEREVIGTGKK